MSPKQRAATMAAFNQRPGTTRSAAPVAPSQAIDGRAAVVPHTAPIVALAANAVAAAIATAGLLLFIMMTGSARPPRTRGGGEPTEPVRHAGASSDGEDGDPMQTDEEPPVREESGSHTADAVDTASPQLRSMKGQNNLHSSTIQKLGLSTSPVSSPEATVTVLPRLTHGSSNARAATVAPNGATLSMPETGSELGNEAAPAAASPAAPESATPVAGDGETGPKRPSRTENVAAKSEERSAARSAKRRAKSTATPTLPVETNEEQQLALAPMVQHLGSMTKELTESQRTVGRLIAERDALRKQVSEMNGVPFELPEENEIRIAKVARVEARAIKQAERSAEADDTPEGDPTARAAAAGRRRRLIALAVVVVLASGFYWADMQGWNLGDFLSKGGLSNIDYVGPLFNVLIAGWLIYRIARVGGKGARWLFPEPEEPGRRRRRR